MNWKQYSEEVEKFVVECGHVVPPKPETRHEEEEKGEVDGEEKKKEEKRCMLM